MVERGVGTQGIFKARTSKVTRCNSPRGTNSTRSQTRKPTMPKKTTRPVSAIPAHKRKELRIVAKFNKRVKSTIPKKVTIIIRCTTEPAMNVLFLNLTKQEAIVNSPGWLEATFCLVPGDEKKQVVDESHKYQHQSHPETLSVCKEQ